MADRGSVPRVVVETDPGAFVERVGAFLRNHPVEHSVLLTVSAQAVAGELAPADGGALWLWAEDPDGTVRCAAMQTPPHPLQLSLGPDDAVRQLAEAVWRVRPHLPGVGGVVPAPEVFASRWLALGGPAAETGMRQGVFVADSVSPPPGVPGRRRPAEPSDGDLLRRWADAFGHETGTGGSGEDLVDPRLAAGRLHIWEVDETVVSMTAVTAAFGGVSRVQLVYTPPEHRRRGYAAALVADVTARKLAEGNRCVLYTDLANATSNGVYRRIGYRWVGEARSLVFVASPTSVPSPRRTNGRGALA
ncbi:MAG TPA: GNAT family N-acetyltransferase [Actinomycetales bacterium]|nr:GNAT family N-acetyltransferase [Actinomycetales bacterium]